MRQSFGACDAPVVECNHDPQMLSRGPYPRALKDRVGGHYGHLSNEQAATLLAEVELEESRVDIPFELEAE